jgi:glycosyltransferase involved in cell wall biosynthesis
MNILQMISKNDRYGAQRIFLDQVSSLHAMGHRVVVAGRGAEGYMTDSVRAIGVEYRGSAMKGLKDIYLLRRLVKDSNIDIIHTTLDRADHFGVLLSMVTRKPVVSTMMVPRYHIGFRFADRVVVLSNKQRSVLLRNGVKPKKISVIRPGIDVDRFTKIDPEKKAEWKRKLRSENYSLLFCHISSLIPRKAHAVSLDLVAACRQHGERPLLIIIGDPLHGEYYESLTQRIAALGLGENVVFTGWTADISEILSLSHFTVLPSENEALGVVLMEGMAAGTPVIAREGEGGAELIEEYDAGFLYRPDVGIEDVADRIIRLRRDPVQYRALSERCKKTAAEEFSLSRFGERLLTLYRSLSPRA